MTDVPTVPLDRDEWAGGFARRLNAALHADQAGVNARIEAMCEATGLDRTRVYAWRTGKSLPNAHAVALLASYFGDIPTDVLLGVK